MSKREGGSFIFTPTGVKVRGKPTFEEWWQQVEQYVKADRGLQWWLGDLLTYGENAYGEKYDQAVVDTGYAYQTLANLSWVSRNVPADVRRHELSWQHHASVARLKPAAQERWLKKAIKEKLSASDLKRSVGASDKRRAAKELADSSDGVRDGRYRVLLADPDWRSTPIETLESVKPPADAKAVVFLWSPAERLRDAIVLLDRWGFAYQTCAVWDRCKAVTEFWFRGQHEVLLVGTRGDFPAPPAELLAPSLVRAKAGSHGKPDEFYRLIEDLVPVKGKRIVRADLFGTVEREGWDVAVMVAPPEPAVEEQPPAEAESEPEKAKAA